jgi:predicted RNA-binding Zn-ribbon protein involved in translation (DUF1610 family)
VSAAAADSIDSRYTKRRCPDCGTTGEFPSTFTQKQVSSCCELCQFHLNHELIHDFRCSVCVASLWRARLRALRILVFYRALLNVDVQR